MAEEIKIVVKQEQQGTALADAKKDAEKLQQQAKSTTSSPAAAATRTQEVQQTSKRLESEKQITKEKERQTAHAKAAHNHSGGMAGARMVGELGDMATGGSGYVMRAQQAVRVFHMLRGLGAFGLLAGGALAAGGAWLGIKSLQFREEDRDRAEQHRVAQARLNTSLRVARMRDYGSSEEAFSMELDAGEERKRLEAKREELVSKAHEGFGGRLFGNYYEHGNMFWKPQSARDIEANEHDQQNSIKAQRQAQIAKKEWFDKIGKKQIEIDKKMAEGKLGEARALQDELTATEEFQRIRKAGGSVEQAQEGAAAKLANIRRERAGSYAHLITARDGVGDTARVATAAHEERVASEASSARMIQELTSTVKDNHADAKATATRRKFER